jgi:hypothetical protein
MRATDVDATPSFSANCCCVSSIANLIWRSSFLYFRCPFGVPRRAQFPLPLGSGIVGSILSFLSPVLRADFFDGDANGDAAFGKRFFADLVPAFRFTTEQT